MAYPSALKRSSGRRARKSTKRSTHRAFSFIPTWAEAFIARRLFDIIAVIFAAAGVFIFAALVTYDHRDPSWNTASEVIEASDIQNIAGAQGAWVADILAQTLGGAGFILAAGLIAWSIRVFQRGALPWFWSRIIALIVAIMLGSLALAQIPSQDWTVHPYLGSSVGTILFAHLSALVASGFVFLIPVIALGLCVLSFIYASGVTRNQMLYTSRALAAFVAWVTLSGYALLSRVIQWLRHYNDPNYDAKQIVSIKIPKIVTWNTDRTPNSSSDANTEELGETVSIDERSEDSLQEQQAKDAKKKDIKVFTPKQADVTGMRGAQQRLNLSEGDWTFPTIDLLQDPPPPAEMPHLNERALRQNAELLQNVLADFNIQGEIVSIHPGPVVTLYELEPAPGTKSSRVINLSDDIARSMSALSVRCAVVPGRNVIGIELPNKQRQFVYLQELLASQAFEKTSAKLPLLLGKDIGGQPVIADLAKMPHLLVAGTTGSGKSVGVNTMILSLIYRLSPEKCRFIMIDPKMLELSVYDDIPHLLSPVVTEPGKAVVALKWAVQEMEERYRSMSKLGVRNIEGYNARLREAVKKGEVLMRKVQTGFDPDTGKPIYEDQPMDMTELPYIVVIVDEFADLMLVAGKDVENAIQRLAQMARAAGIHLIMATQRPSVDVITGVIKSNFPTRISFSVTSKIDSRTILGEGGAEQLLGMGDMLYMPPGGQIKRVHGPFASDEDVENVVAFLKSQSEPAYLDGVTEGIDTGGSEVMAAMFGDDSNDEQVDELYDQAVALVAREQKASTSFVQRYFKIGYNRAARMIEEMERQGVISPATKTGKREVLVQDVSEF